MKKSVSRGLPILAEGGLYYPELSKQTFLGKVIKLEGRQL